MAKFWKRGAALLLAGVLCAAGLSGCSKKAEAKTIYTFNGEKVDADLTNFLFRYGQAGVDQSYGQMFASYYGQSLWTLDLSGTGEAYGDTYKEEFGEVLEKLLLAEEHAADYGVELTDDEKKAITEAAEKFLADNDADTLKSMSATQESVERALALYTWQAKVEKEMSADVDTEVSDEEAAQRNVSYISYTPTTEAESEEESELSETEADAENTVQVDTEGETSPVETEEADKTGSAGETEAAAAQTEAEAAAETEAESETEDPALAEAREKYLAMAQEELNKLLAEGEDLDFAQVTSDVNAESVTGVYASSYTFGKDDTYPAAEIIEATNDLADNTLVDHVVEANGTYYILYVNLAFDEEATEDKKEEIVEDRRSDRIDELYEGWIGEESFTTDAEALAALLLDRVYNAAETTDTEVEVTYETEFDTEPDDASGTEAEITAAETEAE